MFDISARSLQIWTGLPRFLWSGFLIGTALLTAHWMTELVSPRPVAALPAAAAMMSPVTVDDVLKVFDKGGAATPRASDFELTGVYAKGRKSGFATFQSSQGARLVLVGDEIQPGLRLVAVASDHVTLRGNGSEWQLEMKSGSGLPKASPSPIPSRE